MISKKIIKREIDRWDPEGFFPWAPEDEYSIEIDDIHNRLKSYKDYRLDEITVAKVISSVFVQWLNHDMFTHRRDFSECIGVSRKILKTWRRESVGKN